MMKEDETSPATVPEASPDANEGSDKKKTPTSKRPLYLGLGIVLVIIVALCIVLPLTLIDNDSSDDSSDTFLQADTNIQTHGADNNGEAIYVLENSRLPLFGSDITQGYDDEADLKRALMVAFRNHANTIIERNIQNYRQQKEWENERGNDGNMNGGGVAPGSPQAMPESMASDFMTMEDSGEASAGSAGGGGADEDVTDFGTNNQEENIDEADIIKADANYVYAGYGDYIVIWDTDGNQVAQVQMPPVEVPESETKPEPEIMVQGEIEMVNSKKSVAPPYYYRPKPTINAMLVTDNHLVAIVSGYNYRPYGTTTRMLQAHRATQIRLYEKTPTGNLTFVGKKDVNGNYADARSIGDVVHLATASSVDIWTYLDGPLDWWNIANAADITEDEYRTLATAKANLIVPNMADKLMRELQTEDGSLPTLLQVNQWFTHVNNTDSLVGGGFDLPYHQSYDVISNMAQVTSFDVTAAVNENTNGRLTASSSAYLAPSYFNTLSGTDEHLVLATSGWDWNPFLRQGEQTTYLVALEIDGATTSFVSVGTLKGHLLNSYALDIVDGELRAATTVERNPWWWGPILMMDDVAVDAAVRPMAAQATVGGGDDAATMLVEDTLGLCPLAEDVDDCLTEDARQSCLKLVQAGCSVMEQTEDCPPTFTCVVEGVDASGVCPPVESLETDNCLNTRNYQECVNLSMEGCTSIAVLESCPVQFRCEGDVNVVDSEPLIDPMPIPPPDDEEPEESRTENYMIVMKIIGENVPPGQMSEKGRVQIGEKHERITSVRFFDNVAYAVTFQRTDPFYVVDMSVPEVLGELKIPGFSSYLHSMNDDNTLLLAVGQNATEEGRETGLMVTVFDATTPSEPKALVSHTFENVDNAYSSSSVQWDYKAFRYIAGKLVVPLEIYYYREWDPVEQVQLPLPEGAENFKGFAVLDVSTTAITEQYRISHDMEVGEEGEERLCRYCSGYLPRRSFVYSGDLMTVQDNIVVSTRLASGEEQWRFNIEVKGEPADCCW